MSSSGKLNIRIVWDGNEIRDVGVKSTRPQAYRMLNGRLPENAIQIVPMLYSVCGKAQQAASFGAISAALGNELQLDNLVERGVACEAMQEHLWRLLMDWPARLGLPQHKQQFVSWYGALKEISEGRENAENFLSELYPVLLGMTDAEWKQIDSYAKLNEWQQSGRGLLAPVFEALDLAEIKADFSGEIKPCVFMPNWSATEVWKIYAGYLDHEFTAVPQYEGAPMETGELARSRHAPLLQDILHKRPSRLPARLIARLADLLDSAEALTQGNNGSRIQSVSELSNAGLSLVRTARGMLLHYVRMEEGRIAEYLIVAPTEWNFHPRGALASGLIGLKENDAERLMGTVNNYVLSLDPCVEYEIGISHA